MLCRRCGRTWIEHHPNNKMCLGVDSDAPATYWQPSGRLYDEMVAPSIPTGTKLTDVEWQMYIHPEVDEVRIVDPNTGGEKGQKPQRFSLIPTRFLWDLATHYGVGARKYEDRNWERGYKWSLSLDAFNRHLNQWLRGEQVDAETGSHHLIAAIWHLIALWFYDVNNKGTDDIVDRSPTVAR